MSIGSDLDNVLKGILEDRKVLKRILEERKLDRQDQKQTGNYWAKYSMDLKKRVDKLEAEVKKLSSKK
jgi:hypothetical protein